MLAAENKTVGADKATQENKVIQWNGAAIKVKLYFFVPQT
jgi:hypothetical protein